MRSRMGYLACLAAVAFVPARAQNIHITYATGGAMVLRGDPASPIQRELSSVLVTGDRVLTGAKSQASVEVDPYHAFDLGPDAEVRFEDVWPRHYEVVLVKGALTWRVDSPNASEVDIQTPSVWVRPSEPGEFAIGIEPGGESRIEALRGNVEVVAYSGSQWVASGQKMIARGSYDNPEFKLSNASRWRRLRTALLNLQMGISVANDVVSAVSDSKAASHKPSSNAAAAPNPHGGNHSVAPPESGHGGHSGGSSPTHPAPSGGGHSAGSVSHSSGSSSSSAASHSSSPASTSHK